MNYTALGPNIFTTSARSLTTGTYLQAAGQQASAASKSTANSLTVSQMLSQPFFGTGGTFSQLWSSYGMYAIYIAAIYAIVKWILPLIGIKILWGKRGGRTGRRRNYSHLARARRRSLVTRRRRSSARQAA
jgi:hypothetical protein